MSLATQYQKELLARIVAAAPCPECGAERGKHCFAPDTKRAWKSSVHYVRRDAAKIRMRANRREKKKRLPPCVVELVKFWESWLLTDEAYPDFERAHKLLAEVERLSPEQFL